MIATAKNVFDFWFKELTPEMHFTKNPELDQILGRSSTPEELEFLKEKGSSF